MSIKKHDKGICSSYLSELSPGHSLNAYIEHNPTFHLPEKSESVIMISNGTGMAPFLGMIHQNKGKDKECHLFWGGKFIESVDLYQPFLVHTERTFSSCMISLSRDQQKRYVQDKVWEQRVLVANSLEKGGHIMICGSIAMRNGVLSTLEKITIQELNTPLAEFEFNGQILTDCY